MFDGWKLNGNMTVVQTKEAIENSRGKKSLQFSKDNHTDIDIYYCTDDSWYPLLTSWYIEYYDHKKKDYTLTRLVADATNKQVRSFLTRLDKVQESKALEYKIDQEIKEEREERKALIDEHIKQNCPLTWEDIVATQETFAEAKQAVINEVAKLNKEYAETVDDEVQRYSNYKQAISFKCDVGIRYQDSMIDWEEYFNHYLKEDIYWDTSDIRLVTDQDFTDLADHIISVRDKTASLVLQLENALREGLKARATWNKVRNEAEKKYPRNNN